MVHYFLKIMMTAGVFLLFFAEHAPAQVLSPKAIPDELAYSAVFHVIRTAPTPHWDYETRQTWLIARGFDRLSAQKLIRIADNYFKVHEEVEAALSELNERTAKSLKPEAADERARIEAKRLVAMRDAMRSIQTELVSTDTLAKVAALIEGVKESMKVRSR
jgi:hypothetical protein